MNTDLIALHIKIYAILSIWPLEEQISRLILATWVNIKFPGNTIHVGLSDSYSLDFPLLLVCTVTVKFLTKQLLEGDQ